MPISIVIYHSKKRGTQQVKVREQHESKVDIMPSQLFRALRCFIFFPAATGSPELSEKKCVPLLKVLQSPPIGAIFGRNCSLTFKLFESNKHQRACS
jgi:hypothetical protein